VTATLKEDEFNAVAPAAWRDVFGSLHGVAAQMCAGAIGHWANERGYHGPIAYVFESGDEDEGDVDNRFQSLSLNPIQSKHIRYHSHSFVKKGGARGLEAADYFAWHWNKFDAETMTPFSEKQKFRDMRKDLRALVMGNPRKYRVFRFIGEALETFLIDHGCHRKGGAAPTTRGAFV
jgi:hypothetical protein